jgi:hypothetical protein
LGQRQGNQPVVAEGDTELPAGQENSATQGDSAVTVESSASNTITTSLSAYLNLTGLDLPITEQVSLQQLNTQALDWDIVGALDSLSILQNSDNPCVATFAEQLAAALQQQKTEGFRQNNPIKQELNATNGCSLPIVPFGFSPYQPWRDQCPMPSLRCSLGKTKAVHPCKTQRERRYRIPVFWVNPIKSCGLANVKPDFLSRLNLALERRYRNPVSTPGFAKFRS